MEDKKFAILIDSDNVSHKYVKTIFDEITNLGAPTIKRIYGDWTSAKPHWKKILLDYALTPMQQYSYTTGKNSTDSAMIIDAMDVLYTGNVDGFCIVSSDSDFTKLATRLREAGKIVIGMGEKHTPQPFVKACSQFKYIDLITKEQTESAAKAKEDNVAEKQSAKSSKTKQTSKTAEANAETKKKKSPIKTRKENATEQQRSEAIVQQTNATAVEEKTTVDKETEESTATPIEEIKAAILKIMEDSDEESGLILASRVGSMLQNKYSDFDCRNYGCKKMTDLLKKMGIPTQKLKDPNNDLPNAFLLYIKVK